jgi:predicted PurR-regulated permease PerM
MNPPDQIASVAPDRRIAWLLAAVSIGLGWILLPFYGSIMWGAIIAFLFAPVYRWFLLRLARRRTLSALLTMLLALIMVVLPLAMVIGALAREAAAVYQRLQSGELNPTQWLHVAYDALPLWATALLDRFDLIDFDTLQRRLAAALSQGSKFFASQALGIGQVTFEFVAGLCIALYLAFFLIRDGATVADAIRRAIPLAPAQQQELLEKFATVIRATVKGGLLVAAIQGALGGVAFWILGVGGALLWAVLMAFLSLVPAVGAALVWLPVALYFLMRGALWQGVALIAYGVLVIGLIDNLLRPMLVGKDTRMPDYVVMITTLGGIAAFGVNGMVLGPVIAAMFIAVWGIYLAARPVTAP